MAIMHGRWDACVGAPDRGEGSDAAYAEPLDGPPRQNEVLREVGGILAFLLGAAVLASVALVVLGAN